jgi:hypothetical protein
MSIDTSRFTIPNIQTIEAVVAAAGGQPVDIQPSMFRHRGRRWVQRIILSATDYEDNANPAIANTQSLSLITGRWWRRMMDEASGVLAALPNFDNQRWDRGGLQAALGAAPIPYSLEWDFDHEFEIPDNDTMFVELCNRATAAGGPLPNTGTIDVAVHGYGLTTGKPRMLHQTAAWPTLIAQAQRLMQQAVTIQNAINQFGESMMAQKLVISTNTTNMALADTRLFNHITGRIFFETKAGLSLCAPDVDNFVPLCAYGSHRNINGLVAIFEPLGDPLITEDSEALGWQFQNGVAGLAERVQVSVVSLLER